MTDPARTRRILGDPALAWLVERLRLRIERGRPLTGTVTRQPATDGERVAIARLLGRPLRAGASASVPLGELDELLRRAAGVDLRAAVEAVVGPVEDRAAELADEAAAWACVLDDAAGWAAPRGLGAYLDELRSSGLLRRLVGGDTAQASALLDGVRRVVEVLPARGVPRLRLAATVLGDSHALDDDRPLTTLVLRAAAALGGGDAGALPVDAGTRRELWASVGVLVGELSAPVLTLSLVAAMTTPSGRLLAAAAEAGEPLPLTLRQLLRDPPRWSVSEVLVCENPTVVAAAADALGAACRPLVCTAGQPTAAVTALLGQLRNAGASLRYHGDLDWPGLTIANGVLTRFGATPWRMGASDYLTAVERSRRPLHGRPVTACWDDELAAVMAERGLRVEEELVLDELLTDLGGSRPQTKPL